MPFHLICKLLSYYEEYFSLVVNKKKVEFWLKSMKRKNFTIIYQRMSKQNVDFFSEIQSKIVETSCFRKQNLIFL